MMNLRVEKYLDIYKEKWDQFVLNNSLNGTFLQTRNFLEYHPRDRFKDNSLIVFKGTNKIAAVIPACVIIEEEKNVFYSHKGSTFGGIIIDTEFFNIQHINEILILLEKYLREHNFNKVVFRNTSAIFSDNKVNLINYFLYKEGYDCYNELSSYIDFSKYSSDILSNFTSKKRGHYRKALKNDLKFKKIDNREGILKFYELLVQNLQKFNVKPVHEYEELIDFKEQRLKNIVDFYGVFYKDEMVAGSMVFKFNNKCFHVQYASLNYKYAELCPVIFLYYNLIKIAKENKFQYFSFGISTEENGEKLNFSLAEFKEGFGVEYSINKIYYKEFINI